MIEERCNLPHPLFRFALNGGVIEGFYAELIYDFIFDNMRSDPETMTYKAAQAFLFHSEKAFYFACSKANIDGQKLRSHLLKIQLGEFEEVEGEAHGSQTVDVKS